MKKQILNLLIVVSTVALIFSGCSDIDYPPRGVTIVDMDDDGVLNSVNSPSVDDRYRLKKFDLNEREFEWEAEADGNWLFINGEWKIDVELNSPQHYRIGINAIALSGSPVVVASTSDENGNQVEHGAFYVIGGEESEQAGENSFYFIEPVYLPKGNVELTFKVFRGNVRLDKVSVVNSSAISPERFRHVSSSLSHPTSSIEALSLFQYLKLQFGSKVLTAQHCSANTNAEIDAVYAATGRYPAVRFGEATGFFANPEPGFFPEVELAEKWHERGGIVAYSWMWGVDEDAFSLSEAVSSLEGSGVATMDLAYVEKLAQSGEVSHSCLQAIQDIDRAAESLATLGSKGIPVLWNPLPDSGSGLYWWGKLGGDSFVRLWRLMYERMVDYHGLDNLIWIWSGGNYQYYPGDDTVDIIGESAFPGTAVGSEAVRLNYTAHYNTDTRVRKLAMITASSSLPSPDVMARDNAGWLIWALYRGDYVIDNRGEVAPEAVGMLDRFYNHELTICLDGLPRLY